MTASAELPDLQGRQESLPEKKSISVRFQASERFVLPPDPAWFDLRVGDFNGDGIDDVMTGRPGSKTLTVALGTKDGAFRRTEWNVAGKLPDWDHTISMDANNDGRTDLIGPDLDPTRWILLVSDGKDSFTEHISEHVFTGALPIVAVRKIVYGTKDVGIVILIDQEGPHLTIYATHFVDLHLANAAEAGVVARDTPYLGCLQWDSPDVCASVQVFGALSRTGHDALFSFNSRTYAGFPGSPETIWSDFGIGELNGDGHPDIFARNSGILGWWIAYSRGAEAIERPIAGLSLEIRLRPQVLLGDFDGDTLDELLAADVRGGRYTVVVPDRYNPPEPKPGPSVCLGYRPVATQESKWGRTASLCPPGYAVFETSIMKGRGQPIQTVHFAGTCCRLPSPDILLDDHIMMENTCPDDRLATGKMFDPTCSNCSQPVRCTKIDTDRYRLGPPLPGAYWGFRRFPNDGPGLERTELPLEVRAGFGRIDYRRWAFDGCLGSKLGSVLTAIGERCPNMRFRELQYRGREGDPPGGTPVQIFRRCRKLGNAFDPTGGCEEVRSGSDR